MGADPREPKPAREVWDDVPDPLPAADVPQEISAPPALPPSPTRSQVRRRRAIALFGFVLWPLATLAFIGGGRGGRDVPFMVAYTAAWVALLVAAGWTSLSKGRRGVGEPVQLSRLAAIGAPALFMTIALLWPAPGARYDLGAVGPFQYVSGCFLRGLLVAGPLLAVSVWSIRHAFPTAAVWRGAALGAASGLGATLVLFFHCGSPYGGHIALGHGMPLVLATLLGAFAGAKIGRA